MNKDIISFNLFTRKHFRPTNNNISQVQDTWKTVGFCHSTCKFKNYKTIPLLSSYCCLQSGIPISLDKGAVQTQPPQGNAVLDLSTAGTKENTKQPKHILQNTNVLIPGTIVELYCQSILVRELCCVFVTIILFTRSPIISQ